MLHGCHCFGNSRLYFANMHRNQFIRAFKISKCHASIHYGRNDRLCVKVKSSPSHTGPLRVAQRRFCSQIPAYVVRSRTLGYGIARCACLCPLTLVLIALNHGGMARLSWPGWLITYRDGLPVRHRATWSRPTPKNKPTLCAKVKWVFYLWTRYSAYSIS